MNPIVPNQWLTRLLQSGVRVSALVLCTVCMVGCQSFEFEGDAPLPWLDSTTDQEKIPGRILAIWTDTVLHQPGKPGVRGFGGRLYFYDDEDTEPIKVDGGVMIYAFDADDFDPSRPEPLKRYVFTPDQLRTHYSRTSMGHSYSIWLPWDEIGGPTKNVSLVTRFEGRMGGVVISQPATKQLPGVNQVAESSPERVSHAMTFDRGQAHSDYPIRQMGYQNDFVKSPEHSYRVVRDQAESESRRDISTIDLPPGFSRHLQSAPASNDVESPSQNMRGQPDSFHDPNRRWPTDTSDETGAVLPSQSDNFMRPGNRFIDRTGSPMEEVELAGISSVRFGSDRSPVRTIPGSPEVPDRTRMQPHRAGWLSRLPPTPRSGQRTHARRSLADELTSAESAQ